MPASAGLSCILKSSVTCSYIGLSMNFLARLVGICADFTAHKSVCLIVCVTASIQHIATSLFSVSLNLTLTTIGFKVMLSLLYS